jgi:methyl-accepting chemotaxis protein
MQMRVGTKIALGFMVMMLFILLLGGFSSYSAGGIKDQVIELQRATTRLTLSLKIENEFTGAIGEARGFVAYGNEKMLDNFSSKLASAMEIEKQILAVTDESKRAVIDKLINDTTEYTKGTANEFIPLVRTQMREQKAGNREQAQALQAQSIEIGKKYVPFAEGIMKGSRALVEENTQIVKNRLEAIQELVQKVIIISIVFGILAIFIASAVTITILRYIKKSLVSIMDSAKRYAKGDLRNPVPIMNSDEFGEIGQAINEMVKGIKTMVVKVVQSSEHMAAASQQLTASADQSAQAANLVAGSIADVAKGMEEQLSAADATSIVVEQMSASVRKVAANANEVAGQSVQAAAKANEGNKSVDRAVSQMAQIEQTVITSAEVVVKLGERSKEIGQIVDTISGISSQTNLLALNAAIEAARAGEQGRGFAVVAEEVRRLAEQSQEAAKEIATLIGEIQGDTDKAVVAMNNGTREVKLGAEVVDASGQAFREISTLVAYVSGQVKEISTAIEQMDAGSRQIVESVQRIDRLSKGAAGEAQTVSAATEEQSAAMEEIASSSQSLAKLAQDLQQVVSMFQI